MKRADAIKHITADCAKNGDVTAQSMRIFSETKMSYATFQEALKQGRIIFRRINKKVAIN